LDNLASHVSRALVEFEIRLTVDIPVAPEALHAFKSNLDRFLSRIKDRSSTVLESKAPPSSILVNDPKTGKKFFFHYSLGD